MKFLIEVVTTGLNFSSLKCGTEPLQMGEGGRGHMWCVSEISVNQKGVVRGISCPQAQCSYWLPCTGSWNCRQDLLPTECYREPFFFVGEGRQRSLQHPQDKLAGHGMDACDEEIRICNNIWPNVQAVFCKHGSVAGCSGNAFCFPSDNSGNVWRGNAHLPFCTMLCIVLATIANTSAPSDQSLLNHVKYHIFLE